MVNLKQGQSPIIVTDIRKRTPAANQTAEFFIYRLSHGHRSILIVVIEPGELFFYRNSGTLFFILIDLVLDLPPVVTQRSTADHYRTDDQFQNIRRRCRINISRRRRKRPEQGKTANKKQHRNETHFFLSAAAGRQAANFYFLRIRHLLRISLETIYLAPF